MTARPPALRCVPLSLEEVRSLTHIPSGFETAAVYVLDRGDLTWRLRLLEGTRFVKTYDSGDPREWLEPYFAETAPDRLRFIGAQRGARTEGLLTYCEMPWNDTIWLMDIRVRPRFRRKGAGSALMRAAQEVARSERVRGIWLETQINNLPAITFYRRHGFAISGFNDHLYDNDDLARQDVAIYMFWETA